MNLLEEIALTLCRHGGLCAGQCHQTRCKDAIEQYGHKAAAILPIMEKVAQAARNKAVRTLEECGHDLAAKEVRAINITAIVEGVK